MTDLPFVSVIMPVHNEAAFIERSLAAVLELLITAREQGQRRARPSARNQVEQLAPDQTSGSKQTDAHGTAV